MYRIKDSEYGAIIEETISPIWMKQQNGVDRPTGADSFEEADGVLVNYGPNERMLGIEGRNMQNYKPTVIVEEVSSDPYIMTELYNMKTQLDEVYQHQTQETVLRLELDDAYTLGVNAI